MKKYGSVWYGRCRRRWTDALSAGLGLGLLLALSAVNCSARGGVSTKLPDNLKTYSIEFDDETRYYQVHKPKAYDPDRATPVVLVFHGGFGRGELEMRQGEMHLKADEENFLAVFPEAAIGPPSKIKGLPYKHWDAGPRADPLKSRGIDDVGFVGAMLDQLAKDYNVDPKRVFATGASNGGTMVYRLACDLADRIAAVAPVAASQLDIPCKPERPISIIHFHGLADRFVVFTGGVGPELEDDWTPVPDTIDAWRKRNKCSAEEEVTYKKGSALCLSYDACSEGTEVALCTAEDGGHTWPGGTYGGYPICNRRPWGLLCRKIKKYVGKISKDISATDVMWEFFGEHPLP